MSVRPPAESEHRELALRSGLDALVLDTTDGQVQHLLAYLDLLGKWNRVYNLSAVRDPQQAVHQHLLDCLAALPALDRHLGRLDAKLLDVGSGGGLPGVVLAIMRPGWSINCIDAVAKKTSFVRHVAGALALKNLRAEHGRVEAVHAGPIDVVVSRAFASLADFTALTRRHLAPGGCWTAMKGRRPDDEVAELPGDVEVFHVEQLRVPGLAAERCLVWMRPK